MNIRAAVLPDFEPVLCFYDAMCKELQHKDFLPAENQGGYPSAQMIHDAICGEELYLGEEDGAIAAACLLDHHADELYDRVHWQTDVPKEQACVLHALRVREKYSGRGYGKAMVRHCIQIAREKHQKAIRLDTFEENKIAQNLYRSLGFQFIDAVELFYKDIGEPRNSYCYELLL